MKVAEFFGHDFKNGNFKLYDANGNQRYYETSEGYWSKREYNTDGNLRYYENSQGYWSKSEYDADGNETYYENSNGTKRGTPRNSCEGKVVEIDGVEYILKPKNQ